MYDVYNIYGILKCVDSRIVHSRIKYCINSISLQSNYKKNNISMSCNKNIDLI